MLTKREGVAIKIETTPGVDSLPDPLVDALLVEGLSWANEGLTMHAQGLVTGFGNQQALYGGHLKAISFSIPIRPSGAAGTTPAEDAVWRACGLSQTTIAGTSNTYADAQGGLETVTVAYYEDGVLHKLTHAVGKPSIKVDSLAPGMIEVSFVGHDSVTDTVFPAFSYDSTPPPVVRGVNFVVDGYQAVIGGLSIDLATEVPSTKNMSSDDGYAGPIIVDRVITCSFDPLATNAATYDLMQKLKSGAVFDLTTGQVGSVAGLRWQINITGLSYTDVSQGERERRRARSVSCEMSGLTGSFEIVYS